MTVTGQPVASYPILAKIRIGAVDTSGLDQKIQPMQQKVDQLSTSVLGLGAKITAASLAAAALVGAGVGFAVKIGAEMENAEAGITSVLMAMEGINAITAKPLAKTIIAQLTEDAAHGAGALEDYVQGFQSLYAPGRAAGAKLEEIRQLTRLAIGAGSTIGGPEGTRLAPIDIKQALTSGASQETYIANMALQAGGISQKAFNAMDPRARLDALMKGFGTFGPAIEVMGRTFEAQTATLGDTLKRHVRTLSTPIFEATRDGLFRVNEALSANEAGLNEVTAAQARLAEVAGQAIDGIAQAIADGLSGVAETGTAWRQAAQVAEDVSKDVGGLGSNSKDAGKYLSEFGAGLSVSLSFLRSFWSNLDVPTTAGIYGAFMSAYRGVSGSMDAATERQTYLRPGGLAAMPEGVPAGGSYFDPATQGLPDYALVGNVDSMLLVDKATDALGKAAKAMSDSAKKEKKVKVDLTMPPIQWGNDRSMRVALGGLLEEVATRAYNLARESADGVDG